MIKNEGYGVGASYVRRHWFLAASMDPLAVVEAQLGSVDSWPVYELTRMFILKPYPRLVKHVAAFV